MQASLSLQTAACSLAPRPVRTSRRYQRAGARESAARAKPPNDCIEVLSWARQTFQQEVSCPDHDINVAKACLLLSLEEEACIQVHPELKEVVLRERGDLRLNSLAGASTWSLERVDALAAEVHALLMPSLSCGQEHGSSNGTEQNKLSNGVISTDCGAAVDQQCSSDAGSPPLNVIGTEAGGTFGTSSNGASELGIRLPHSFLARHTYSVVQAINTVLFERHGYKACNRWGQPQDTLLSTVLEIGVGTSATLAIVYKEVAARLGLEMGICPLEEGRYFIIFPLHHTLQLPPQPPSQTHSGSSSAPDPAPQPVQNEGTDSLHQLSPQEHQLDGCQHLDQEQQQQQQQQQQQGAPVTQASRLEDRCVVDPYGQGSLMTVGEVSELFGEEPDLVLTPAPNKQLLACLVLELMQAHWAAAHGGSAMPAASIPLSVDTALDPTKVPRSLRAHAAERVVAAAEKRMWLLPHDREAQLAYGLACFFARNWDDAWIELGLYLERAGWTGREQSLPATPSMDSLLSNVEKTAEDQLQKQGRATGVATGADPQLLERVELLLEKVRLRLTLS